MADFEKAKTEAARDQGSALPEAAKAQLEAQQTAASAARGTKARSQLSQVLRAKRLKRTVSLPQEAQ